MRLLDILRNNSRAGRELSELSGLQARLRNYAGSLETRRNALISNVLARALAEGEVASDERIGKALRQLLTDILAFEGLFTLEDPSYPPSLTTAGIWEAIRDYRRRLAALEDRQVGEAIVQTLTQLVANIVPEHLPLIGDDTAPALSAPLSALLPRPAFAIEGAMGVFLTVPREKTAFPKLWERLEWNLLTASGINPGGRSSKLPVTPTKAKEQTAGELITAYLGNTPLQSYFETLVPFALPLSARLEHTHVVGGSGHGKTQLLQSLILRDMERLKEGQGSIVIIDSQGDMIRTILGLADLQLFSERLVLIDPNDIEYPPCLNLFDFGLSRLSRYEPVEREKLINGAIALYEYMFGALLGAELTARQGVIFRYLARLLMVVPGATIHTLREFLEHPEAARAYILQLDPVSRAFFETQFFSKIYDDTRAQILTRLWAVISNAVLARMFSYRENKVDLFSALNSGSLLLVNTAKDLLKQDGCAILGRFFIALIAQAAQERSVIPEDRRRITFVYIDEAQDYFDEGIENLLNQARKYKVGLVLAHQNLGQFEPRLQQAVMASTSVKLAGGVSAKDAFQLAREMGCAPEFLLGMRKHRTATDFACFVRNVTPQPVQLSAPFGQMESRPRMTKAEREVLLWQNRGRFCAAAESEGTFSGIQPQSLKQVSGLDLGEPEVL